MRSHAFVRTPAATSRTDADVCQQVLSAPADEASVPKSLVNVEVHDGVVELRGSILGERERQALRVLAENTPGVKVVKGHLVSVEPMSGLTFEPPRRTVSPA